MKHQPTSIRVSSRHSVEDLNNLATSLYGTTFAAMPIAKVIDAAVELLRQRIDTAGEDREAAGQIITDINRAAYQAEWREGERRIAEMATTEFWQRPIVRAKEGV